jgi:hypothetical protein
VRNSLRYDAEKAQGVWERPNVNPLHHNHRSYRGFYYEPPTWKEMGGASEEEEILMFIQEGKTDPELREIGYSQSQIDEARRK